MRTRILAVGMLTLALVLSVAPLATAVGVHPNLPTPRAPGVGALSPPQDYGCSYSDFPYEECCYYDQQGNPYDCWSCDTSKQPEGCEPGSASSP